MNPDRSRAGTVLGWLAGAALGLIVSVTLSWFLNRYAMVPGTFVCVVAGCFGGMTLADRLGKRAPRVLALSAGVLLAVLVLGAALMAIAD